MKLLILTFSILFLASCQQYQYNVTYEKCNGQTGSLSVIAELYGGPNISNYKTALTELYYYTPGIFGGKKLIALNVCDFSYTRNPISKGK